MKARPLMLQYFEVCDDALGPELADVRCEGLRTWRSLNEPHVEEKEEIYRHLLKLRNAGLLEAVGEEHLYYAALNSKAAQLTPLGRFYWTLAERGRI